MEEAAGGGRREETATTAADDVPIVPIVPILAGDLLQCDATYIVHQCNCVTKGAAGLAAAMFRAYPSANVYADGSPRTPGTIAVRGRVVNLFGQNLPGQRECGDGDSATMRQAWFRQGLHALLEMLHEAKEDTNSVAFPYLIGCGLAGGHWPSYYAMICEFAAAAVGVHVFIVRL